MYIISDKVGEDNVIIYLVKWPAGFSFNQIQYLCIKYCRLKRLLTNSLEFWRLIKGKKIEASFCSTLSALFS